MGSQRLRDSAIVQLVFAFENASVAAVKREISIALGEVEAGGTGSLAPDMLVGISFGFWVDVIGAGSVDVFGEEGGVGYALEESCAEALGEATSVFAP